MTYADSVRTNTAMAAGTDHQILEAMTGSPMSNQAPTILVRIPLALRSANQSGTRFTIRDHPIASRPRALRSGVEAVTRKRPGRLTPSCPGAEVWRVVIAGPEAAPIS